MTDDAENATAIAQSVSTAHDPAESDSKPALEKKLLLNLDEAARLLGIPVGTLRTWSWARRVPCVRLGRRRFFRRDDLIRWIDMNICQATGRLPSRLTESRPKRYRPVQGAQPVKGG
ncbi:MAG: helix-turn-helix domain-containing protein [Deltaproteobacteria bacterium]|nr:helix-turn-helix domain-containing protein [Deltaproteobacteria bacterium]